MIPRQPSPRSRRPPRWLVRLRWHPRRRRRPMVAKVPENYVYLDYAATAPLCEEAAQAMAPYMVPGRANIAFGGNANSLHIPGRAAFSALEDASPRHRARSRCHASRRGGPYQRRHRGRQRRHHRAGAGGSPCPTPRRRGRRPAARGGQRHRARCGPGPGQAPRADGLLGHARAARSQRFHNRSRA